MTVTDPGPPRPQPDAQAATAGRGLIGMRQRVDLFGGTLFAGPVAGGGFLVDAAIPVAQQ